MANLAAAVYDKLAADAAVAALVGTRIYRMILPQTVTYPAISYQQISGQRTHTLNGADDPVIARIQIDCWSESVEECRDLAEQARQALHEATGAWGSLTIQAAHHLDEREFYDSEALIFRRSIDLEVWHAD